MQVRLLPQLEATGSLPLVKQFLFRLYMIDGGPVDHLPLPWLANEAGPYTAQAEEYCFGFEAMDLTASDIHPYVALTPRCVPHGDLPDLGERDADVPDGALDRLVCQSPPAGFEDRWCALNRGCAELAPEARAADYGCALYGHTCLGEDLPEPSIVGGTTGGSEPPVINPGSGGNAGMGTATGGTNAIDPEADADRPRLVRSGCGCFVAARREASPAAPLLFALGLLALAQRALRRRRASV